MKYVSVVNRFAWLCVLLWPLCGLAQNGDRWAEVAALLQEAAVDYPEELENGRSPTESIGQLGHALDLLESLEGKQGPTFALVKALWSEAKKKGASLGVAPGCQDMAEQLISVHHLSEVPPSRLDLRRAAAAYQQLCRTCHGDSRGPGPSAAQLPKPAPSFLDLNVINPLSPRRAYYAIRYGGYGTSMPAFVTLSDQEIWEISFFLFTQRHQKSPAKPKPNVPLSELAASSDNRLMGLYGEKELGPLRLFPTDPVPPPKQSSSKK